MSVHVSGPVSLKQWNEHTATWSGCKLCSLGCISYQRALCRGSLPCDVLFIGEGPGRNENSVGVPFVGRAGLTLDRWVKSSGFDGTWAVTNMVACRPTDTIGGSNRQPKVEEVEACRPRLLELMKLANPKAVVLIGTSLYFGVASRFGPPYHLVHGMYHPAYVLRMGGEGCVEDRQAVASLSEFLSINFKTKMKWLTPHPASNRKKTEL